MDQFNQAMVHRAAVRIAVHLDHVKPELDLFEAFPAYVLHQIIRGTLERVITLVQSENREELTLALLNALTGA